MTIVSTSTSEEKPVSNSKVKENGSQIPEDGTLLQSSEIVEEKQKQKRKRNENPGVRIIGNRIYDSENGKTCHQINAFEDQLCRYRLCISKLYGVKAEEMSVVEDWFCPKCRDNCNCSFCMKKRGHKPIGILVHTAKSIGFSSVSEMLLAQGSDYQSGKENPLSIQEKHGKNIVSEDIVIDLDDQKCRKMKNIRRKMELKVGAEIPLPRGSEIKTVLSIELQPEEIGPALQFLEFCSTFGEIIGLKKDESQFILRDMVRGGRGRQGKFSPVANFFVQLLSLLQSNSGERSTVISNSSSHENSWLRALHKYLFESNYLCKQLKLDQFDGGADSYDRLNLNERFKLLNFVCDEVLCTRKARSYIDEQKLKNFEKVKDIKEKLVVAKNKENQFKQKMKDEMAQAAKNCIPLSEHKEIVSKYKMQVVEAHNEMLQSKEMLCTEKQHCKANRTNPILVDTEGHSFWRLKGFDDEINVLRQDVSLQHESESSEKWFTYEKQQEEIKKYLSYR
ncbi:uncharacterized protein LOC124937516 [Impatiens glandulifera]|uniref:uncharacterized protein LOC124937516 n=1 Tax=Impatiens glandulifera TaxID=253017 RepID=UPI001FB12989|nr:uncharacterized protein LOC124937516 [Impatiens glandulifera]